MGAKDIIIKPIDAKSSRAIVSRLHYSGKCTQNSQIHFGVFYKNKLEGALQFGPSTDKRRMAKNLDIGFNESIELNRMAISDVCPKNTESRALSICLKIIKKKYPFLKVVISFADACQCGDGTIYRAAGFKLHSFKRNKSLLVGPSGDVVSDKSLNNKIDKASGKYLKSHYTQNLGYKPLSGYQMKYLYCLDKSIENKYKWVPFDKIPEQVKMYKGKKRVEHDSNAPDYQSGESGAEPTNTLQLQAGGVSD